MNVKRTATIVVAGGALAAWLAAAATSGTDEGRPHVAVNEPQSDAREVTLALEIAKLHDRLRPDAAPREPGRNLFLFAAARPRPMPVASSPALTEAPAAPVAAPPPVLKLSGIAEDVGPGGPSRTAIISGLGQLFLVKEGEPVTGRYRVAKITADLVELADIGGGTALRLPLK